MSGRARTSVLTLLGLALALLVACVAPARDPERARRAVDAAFDVEHYALDLAIDPAARTLRGACRIRLWPTHAAIEDVELDLVGLAVDSVIDAAGRTLRFTQRPSRVRIALAEPVRRGEYAEFTLRYGGRPAKGLYFAGDRGDGPTQVWTHGECIDARAWFPCVDEPWERATSDLVIRVPRDWRVLAAGERLERRVEGDDAIETWRTTFPHPAYLQSLVAGDFALVESIEDGIPLAFAAEPRLAPYFEASLGETQSILAFLARATGVRYPYPKYSQAAVDGFLYGGMENLSATTLRAGAVTDPTALADQPSTGLVAHEAAHQWFGNLVTCADWSHAWLNEGFATYFASLYVESSRGEDAFLLEIDDHRASWLARDSGANRRPLVHLGGGDPILSFLTGHIYQGGAARLHHLRRLLGDARFFRGVRLYLGENAGRGVVTDDLRRALEAASGRDLRANFTRWFESPGHPRVELASQHDAQREELTIDVRQTQEEPPFPLLVEIEIADDAGLRVERFELERRAERFVLRQGPRPRWVRLDPACALPAAIVESRTFGEWLSILASAPDAAGRRLASRFLRGHLRTHPDRIVRDLVARGLLDSIARDPSPAVRRAGIEAFSRPIAGEERAVLVERARDDVDPAVRAAAFRALEPESTGAGDPELAGLARAELGRGASHVATGAALGLLVRAEPCDALDVLWAQAATPSTHGERAARVLAEIGRLADPRGRAILRSVLRDEALPDAPRRVAIAELGRHVATDAEARADLEGLLDSPRSTLRLEALRALAGVPTPDVRARLRRHARETADGRERAAALSALAVRP